MWRLVVAGLLLLAGAAAAQRGMNDAFTLSPQARVTALAESNWWAAHAEKCGLRDRAWLERVYQRISEEIANELRGGVITDPNAGMNIAAYWGAAAMARRLGEQDRLSATTCHDLRAGSAMWLLDRAAAGEPMPLSPRAGNG